jgi:hypothetical protein
MVVFLQTQRNATARYFVFPDHHVQHLVWSRRTLCLASEFAGPTPPDFFAWGFQWQCAHLASHRHGWSKGNDCRSLSPNHVGDVERHVVRNWSLVINSVALRANYMIHSLRSLQVICANVNRCNFTTKRITLCRYWIMHS